MNRIDILNIVPSTGSTPSHIEVNLDYTSIFHGKEWIDGAGTRFPSYTYDTDSGSATPPPPYGTTVLRATTFQIVENEKYGGTYTVYTPTTVGDPTPSSSFAAGVTKIYVREAMVSGTGTELTDGTITNISTYLLSVTGESSFVLLENQRKTNRPININGRFTEGWGEDIAQNQLKQAQSFAGPSAPTSPFQGQLWYDTIGSALMIFSGAPSNTWSLVNSAAIGGSYRHTQASASANWTVNHNLALASPFICFHSFFVDTGGGVIKPITPSDVTYVNANQFTVTFSTPYSGYVLVRQ